MKRTVNLVIAAAIVLALLGFMFTFTVRFNETAIVTTFGGVSEGSVYNAPIKDPATGAWLPGRDAGLKFKWPWPIQQVARTYDTRLQVLEGVPEQQSTQDNQTIVVTTYLTWRISDPRAFFQSLSTREEAVAALNVRMQAAKSALGNYTFDELTNSDPSRLKLDAVEAQMRQLVQTQLAGLNLGIEVEDVGIKRLVLPTSVTEAVASRMRAERGALAVAYQVEGDATAATLRTGAEAQAEMIRSFADARGREIEAEGKRRAQEIAARFAQDQDFAIFLDQLQTLEQALAGRARFVIDTSKPPFNLLRGLPEAQPQDPASPSNGREQANAQDEP